MPCIYPIEVHLQHRHWGTILKDAKVNKTRGWNPRKGGTLCIDFTSTFTRRTFTDHYQGAV